MVYNTETLDKLYLELSQFTQAKTRRELELEVALTAAASNMRDEIVKRVREKADYYAERERNAERNVAKSSVEQEKKLAFMLSNFSSELATELEAIQINDLPGNDLPGR